MWSICQILAEIRGSLAALSCVLVHLSSVMHTEMGGRYWNCRRGGIPDCRESLPMILVPGIPEKEWECSGRFASMAHSRCGVVSVCFEEGDLIKNIWVPKSFWIHTDWAENRESVGSVASVLFPLGWKIYGQIYIRFLVLFTGHCFLLLVYVIIGYEHSRNDPGCV